MFGVSPRGRRVRIIFTFVKSLTIERFRMPTKNRRILLSLPPYLDALVRADAKRNMLHSATRVTQILNEFYRPAIKSSLPPSTRQELIVDFSGGASSAPSRFGGRFAGAKE